MYKKIVLFSGILLVLMAAALAAVDPAGAKPEPLTGIELLGKRLFFDKALSLNNNQSCASCHGQEYGYTGPKSKINAFGAVYPGSIPDAFGDRKPPTSAYGGESPILYFDGTDEVWVGGMFWDGRAAGWQLGDPFAEQAMGPFLNPAEQAIPDAETLCWKVYHSNYAKLFVAVWGVLNCETPDAIALVYEQVGRSIAAYERSYEVNPFNSKFDAFWDNAIEAGMNVSMIDMDNWMSYTGYGLTNDEVYGLALFNDDDKGKCSLCHPLNAGTAGYPVFTDFTYDNLGIPKNPYNPVYDTDPEFIDPGLGNFLMEAGFEEEEYMAEWGKFKVPTLRNVDKRVGDGIKAYGHNGYFKSLYDIVHYYNTRDVVGVGWPEPEYSPTINYDELGDLGLTTAEENLIVLFMQTLTDKTKP